MQNTFKPDYKRIVSAAKNENTDGIPLYEHDINIKVISAIINKDLVTMYESRVPSQLKEMFTLIADFHISHGYDTYSFEGCFTQLVQGGKGLVGQAGSIIQNKEELENFPWEQIVQKYFDEYSIYFDAIRESLPEGMKIVGGVGNGIFEIIQDFVPFTELAYFEIDEPGLFTELWEKIGDTLYRTWKRFLEEYSDILAVGRFGDDLGFKSSTLLSPQNIKKHIIPQYKKIITLVKSKDIPFLLHSCGCIFDVMDDIIKTAGINAKHSNEDSIAPFSKWVEDYGDKIGIFGGFDMDFICRNNPQEIRHYVRGIIEPLMNSRGIAFGSGNQIADYVPPENFQAMVDEIRLTRGF